MSLLAVSLLSTLCVRIDADQPESGDHFGRALAHGDFDHDGYQDLAVGVPGEGVDGLISCGAVDVIYGGLLGLSSSRRQFWHQNVSLVAGEAESYEEFGFALASGDFNDDEYDDLAIGVPLDWVGSIEAAGAVNVIYGSPTGLDVDYVADQLWNQNVPNVAQKAAYGDYFGSSLAAGDFNGDGYDDLAVGASLDEVGQVSDAGVVHVLYGSGAGLSATAIPDQLWHQNTANVAETAEASDEFGAVFAVEDFNSDGYDDLAIGVPLESVGTIDDAGAVHVIHGSPAGLSATSVPDQLWQQNTANVADVAEPSDVFGAALATGDFNADGSPDLAVGVPAENPDGPGLAGGAVHIFHGTGSGLSAALDYLICQCYGFFGDNEFDDSFGGALAAGDFTTTPTPIWRSAPPVRTSKSSTYETNPAQCPWSTARRVGSIRLSLSTGRSPPPKWRIRRRTGTTSATALRRQTSTPTSGWISPWACHTKISPQSTMAP